MSYKNLYPWDICSMKDFVNCFGWPWKQCIELKTMEVW